MTGLTGIFAKIQTSGGPFSFNMIVPGGGTIDVGDGNGPQPLAGNNENNVTTTPNTDIIIVAPGATKIHFGSDRGSAYSGNHSTNMTSLLMGDQASSLEDIGHFAADQRNLAVFDIFEKEWTNNVLDAGSMFSGCISLTSFPEMYFPLVTDISEFLGGTGVLSFPLINFPKVIEASTAWRRNKYTSFPLIEMPLVTNLTLAWASSENLLSFPTLLLPSCKNISQAWNRCEKLVSFPPIDFPVCKDFGHTWQGCTGLTDFPHIDISSGTDFDYTWSECSNLVHMPSLDFSSSTSLAATFRLCSSLLVFPPSDFSHITNFHEAFSSCVALKEINTIDVSSGEDFSYMFRGCSSLTLLHGLSLPATATNLDATFAECKNLKYISNLHTPNATNTSGLFQNCTSLICIGECDTTSSLDTSDMFTNTPVLQSPNATERAAIVAPGGIDWVNPSSCPPTDPKFILGDPAQPPEIFLGDNLVLDIYFGDDKVWKI